MSENPDTSQAQSPTPSKPSISVGAVMQAAPPSLRAIFAPVLCLDENDMYMEASCPLCTSKHRREAEKLYKSFDKYVETYKKEDSVKTFLDHKEEPLSYDCIRNHMTRHMDRGSQELRKAEYIGRIDALSASKMSSIDIADRAINTLIERIVGQSELAPDSKYTLADIEDMRTKNIATLNNVLLKAMQFRADLLGEMKKEGSAFTIPKDVFVRVFDEAMKKAHSQEEKMIVAFIMKGLGGG